MDLENQIGTQWSDFEAKVVPASAGLAQRLEMKRAFFAGAVTLLGIMDKINSLRLPEDQEADQLDGIERELKRFSRDQARLAAMDGQLAKADGGTH